MAIGTHVAVLGLVLIDSLGNVVVKDTTTIGNVLDTTSEFRVLVDSDIPSSAGNPTIQDYLEAEGAIDFILGHMTQSFIVTYSAADLNAA